MKDLVTVTTRISKDLKEKVNDFSKKNDIKTQVIYKIALNDFLEKYKSEERRSEVTLFLDKKLKEANGRTNRKAHEFIDSLLDMLKEKGISLNKECANLKLQYDNLMNMEVNALLLYEDSLK